MSSDKKNTNTDMKVFVKNMRGQALMPCSQRKARILLKQKKAKIVDYKPFTIQLLYATGENKQEVIVNVNKNADPAWVDKLCSLVPNPKLRIKTGKPDTTKDDKS